MSLLGMDWLMGAIDFFFGHAKGMLNGCADIE